MYLFLCSIHAFAHVGGFHDWPQQQESVEDISHWVFEDDWFISPVREITYDGTRLGVFIDKLEGNNVSLEVRWFDGRDYGPWYSLRKTFERPTLELLVQDFPQAYSAFQFRSKDPSFMQYLEWDLLSPRAEQMEDSVLPSPLLPPPPNTQLSQSLIDIGVIPRTQWGAQQTTCTNPENEWYRMAIHHVASRQTYNGSVEARVQALQAWAIASGTYCDIPYQYLVGYDGTLWEARPINLYSGATGGGNNNGNIAISFIGCYDQSACQSSFGFYDQETDIMMARARELIQTLALEHGIAVNTDNVKAHKDWPNNSTVCPGNYIINRFSELLSPVSYYDGQIGGMSHTDVIQVTQGESVDVWIDITNVGMWEWDSDTTLAPYPRDTASVLSDSTWLSPERVQGVGGLVSPGETHRFSFRLHGSQTGLVSQHFTLLQEGLTWFADTPFGGGLSDTEITFLLEVLPAPEPSSEPSSEPSVEPSNEPSSEEGNFPPVAIAGNEQEVFQGETVYLHGDLSYDPEGESLFFGWRFLADTEMEILQSATARPYFEATDIGVWEVELVVFDGVSIASDTVTISIVHPEDVEEETEEQPKQACSSLDQPLSFCFTILMLLVLSTKRTNHPIRPSH